MPLEKILQTINQRFKIPKHEQIKKTLMFIMKTKEKRGKDIFSVRISIQLHPSCENSKLPIIALKINELLFCVGFSGSLGVIGKSLRDRSILEI